MEKPTLALLFGGISREYEISLLTAASMLTAYRGDAEPVRFGMTREGDGFLYTGPVRSIRNGTWQSDSDNLTPASLVRHGISCSDGRFIPLSGALLATHGGMTEDGRLQGLLDLLGIPYAGCGAEACAVTMNKHLTKTLLSRAGIPVAPWVTLSPDLPASEIDALESAFPYPVFVKPARSGSSIGAGIARSREELIRRVADAQETDRLILAEPFLSGIEVEVALLDRGDGTLLVSPPGRPIYAGDAGFYDYDAKYLSGSVDMQIPAALPPETASAVRDYAERAFSVLGCRHYARADFIVGGSGIVLNELNALPGMTGRSMFPSLIAAAGIPIPALLSHLTDLAIGRRGKA